MFFWLYKIYIEEKKMNRYIFKMLKVVIFEGKFMCDIFFYYVLYFNNIL